MTRPPSTSQPAQRPVSRSAPRRRLPFAKLGPELDKLTRKAFTKYGFADDHVLTRWSEIVGPQLARLTSPERLSRPQRGQHKNTSGGSTLTVRVAGAAALEMQHLTPQIIDKINGFYGRPVVSRLKLVQGPLPTPLRKPAKRPSLFGTPKKTVTPEYEIDDPELAQALARLEQAVADGKS